jgi:mono/diheme cytochrome c family protein/cytochrome c553
MLMLMALLACDDQIFTGGGGHHSSDDGGDAEAVLVAACGSCHASSLAPTLSEKICENTVDVMATQVDMPFIAAGDPANSYLLLKMQGTAGDVGGVDSMMPPTGALPEADIKIVEDWIAAGAICSSDSDDTEDTGDVVDTGDVDDTDDPGNTGNLDQGIPPGSDATRGMELFNQHCANCHVNGNSPDLQTIIPNIGNASIENAIQNGIGGMPAIQAVASQQDTDDIIAYLRTTYPSQNQGGGDTNGGNPGDSGNNGGGSQVDGEELVNIHCNSCHVNGYAPTFDTLMPYMGLSEVEDAIINGTSGGMPSFQFSQEELNAITFYLSDEFGN